MNFDKVELESMPTLSVGQCCSLKVETENVRVWICRVGGGVSVEQCIGGRWKTVAGGCIDSESDPEEVTP